MNPRDLFYDAVRCEVAAQHFTGALGHSTYERIDAELQRQQQAEAARLCPRCGQSHISDEQRAACSLREDT